jgi:CRP-like cAMP-binding protein
LIKKGIKEKKDYIYEEERLVLKEGMCFGEWGLLYGKERTASAIAIEDCDLFCLDKEGFEKSFGVNKS